MVAIPTGKNRRNIMAKTMAQALADRLRYQIESGEKVLAEAGDNSDAVFGDPQEVLSVCGNVSDVAHTNHLWLLDAKAAGAIANGLPAGLQRPRPDSVGAAVEFLAPRESDTCSQATSQLRLVNETFAAQVENLSDEELERTIDVTFYGEKSLRDLLFIVIEHGALHLGQAWGILKGKGVCG